MLGTEIKLMMISHTQRLREKYSDTTPFLAPVTISHKTYTLSGRDTNITVMLIPMNAYIRETGILSSVGRKNEEFITVSMVCVIKLLRRIKWRM